MEEIKDYKKYFKGIAKQLNRVYRREISQRTELGELMFYSEQTTQIANCLEHAIFNFTDEELLALVKKNGADIASFWRGFESLSSRFEIEPEEQLEKLTPEIIERITSTGLQIEECDIDAKPEEGQWKVAYYFNLCDEPNQYISDFHFFRQEKDGTWSSKMGMGNHIRTFRRLPELFEGGYKLQKIFMITNPYLSKEMQEEKDE